MASVKWNSVDLDIAELDVPVREIVRALQASFPKRQFYLVYFGKWQMFSECQRVVNGNGRLEEPFIPDPVC